MGTIVSNVIEALTAAQIRADEAYPSQRIPALSGPVAAVRLGKVDRSIRTTAVQVVIMSPAKAGGSVCEATALRAVEVLQGMDGTCVKDVCKFDEMANVFYIEIEADFFGTALEDSWSPGPGYAIKLGAQSMKYATSFSAQRSADYETGSISNSQWSFVLEEQLPPGASEPPDPAEPFTVTVSRVNGDEQFTGCTWISVRREETIRGVSQVRSGLATTRNVMGIL